MADVSPAPVDAPASPDPGPVRSLADSGLSTTDFVAPASPAELASAEPGTSWLPPPAAPSVPAPVHDRLAAALQADVGWTELLEQAGALLDTYSEQLTTLTAPAAEVEGTVVIF